MSFSMPPLGGPLGEYPIGPVSKESAKTPVENVVLPKHQGKPVDQDTIARNHRDLKNGISQMPDALNQVSDCVSKGKLPLIPCVSMKRYAEIAAIINQCLYRLLSVADRREEYGE